MEKKLNKQKKNKRNTKNSNRIINYTLMFLLIICFLIKISLDMVMVKITMEQFQWTL